MITKYHRVQSAFTLIELSIVLVIIGLIVGGVLTGRELIRSATLKTIITDEQKYITAANTFRTKYSALPGDMTNATSYWGTSPNGCPDISGISTAKIPTCNGNGDGVISSFGSNGDPNWATLETEGFLAWQHLSNAGLVPGPFSGTMGLGANIHVETAIPNVNALLREWQVVFFNGIITIQRRQQTIFFFPILMLVNNT